MSNIIAHGKRMVPEDLVKRLKRGEFTIKLNDIEDVKSLTDKQINSLKAGDVIVKKTGDQTHTYFVTYKEENHGICISYFNAGYSETVSYDYIGGHWVYNSTDICTENHLWLVSIGFSDFMLTMISTKGFEYTNNDFYTSGVLDENINEETKSLIAETLLNVKKTSYDNRVIGAFSSDIISSQYFINNNVDFVINSIYGEDEIIGVKIVDNSQLQSTISDTIFDYHIQIQKLL